MLHGLVAVVLSGLIGIVPTLGTRSAAAPVTTARLSVRLTTTTDWAAVSFSPATVVTARVISKSAGITVHDLPTGWMITSTSGAVSTVQFDAVVEERSGARTITTTVTKGFDRAAGVDIVNTSYEPVSVLRIVNREHVESVEIQSVQRSLSREAFLGTRNAPLRRVAEARRLVLAFYYPWWHPGSYATPAISDRPAEPRFTSVAADVDAMTAQARANGIDGFVVSWWGEEPDGLELGLALRAAEGRGGVVTAYLETAGANPAGDMNAPPRPFEVGRRLNQALAHASSPAFLRSDGVPVVFVYQMEVLTPAAWREILDALAGMGRPVRLVGDAPMERYGGVSWGYHQYSPNSLTPSQLLTWNRANAAYLRILSGEAHLFAATVSPGYNDQNLRGDDNPIVPRGSMGERYAATWQAARASAPDWVLVTSWNEWYEGTGVQPGVQTGDLALRQTGSEATAFRAGRTG